MLSLCRLFCVQWPWCLWCAEYNKIGWNQNKETRFSSCIAIYLLMVCQGWMLNPLVFFKACKFRRCRVVWCYHGVTVVGIHCWIRKYIFFNKTWWLNSLNQLIRSALWTMLFSTPWTLWAKGEPWYLARDSFPLNKTTVFRNSVDSFDVVAPDRKSVV